MFSTVISFHSGFFLFQAGPLIPGAVAMFFFSSMSFSLLSVLLNLLLEGMVALHQHSILYTSEIRGKVGRVPGGLGTL